MIITHSDSVGMEAGPSGPTVKMAPAAVALVPVVVTKAPAGRTLACGPTTVVVTSTVTVQLPEAGIVPPAGKVTVEAPATATGAPTPPQVVPTLGVAAITIPLGKVSTSGAVRVATATSGLFRVMVSVETPPAARMVGGLKALPSVGVVPARLHTETAYCPASPHRSAPRLSRPRSRPSSG